MSQTTQTLALPRIARTLPMRGVLAAVLLLAATAGYLATPAADAARAVAQAGPELTQLLRMMALLKLAFVAGAAAAVQWRLRYPTPPALVAGYLAGMAAMAAAPGLIWSMAHVVAGAVLLHGGLALVAVLFWRDPGSPLMLQGLRRRP